MEGITIAAARRAIADTFRQSGIESPELDARILVGHLLGLDHTALVTSANRTLDVDEGQALSNLVARRIAREPIARIVGSKEFWSLQLRVIQATLVPRPETETVVEAALAAIDATGDRTRPLRIADLGTGSGAILLALLSELPCAFGIGTEISYEALQVARENAIRYGLSPRAAMVACDFGAALAGGFDLVVANPPYIAISEIEALAPEVRHDPLHALDGGHDGLAAYRAIAADARRLIKPLGHLVLELGTGQLNAVTKLLQAQNLLPGSVRSDLNGIARALTASVATMTR
jgi:release factor glutamine methyltransferase